MPGPSSHYFGSACAAILTDHNETQLFYQNKDGAIHRSVGGVNVSRSKYTDSVVVKKDVRINSPIAAVLFGKQVHIFYINESNYISEKRLKEDGTVIDEGKLLAETKARAAPNSNLLYAITTKDKKIRVGYQSGATDSFGKVAEAEWEGTPGRPGWSNKVIVALDGGNHK